VKSAFAIVCVFAGVAGADSTKPPAGWTTDPAAAVSLSKQLSDVPHFGGLRSVVTTEVYRTQGGSLFVTRASTSVAGLDIANRDEAATIELDEVRLAMRRADGKAISDQANFADGKLMVAEHRWHDDLSKVANHSRGVVASDGQQMVAVTGECVLAGDVAKAVDEACVAALASLDPGISEVSRVVLTTVKTAPVPPPVPAGSGGAKTAPSLVDGGERLLLPPMQIPQEPREADRRPIFIGLGLIVLAVIFYWNRKNRERLEREYEQRTPATKSDTPEPARPADRDADDLHAAADDKKESKS